MKHSCSIFCHNGFLYDVSLTFLLGSHSVPAEERWIKLLDLAQCTIYFDDDLVDMKLKLNGRDELNM